MSTTAAPVISLAFWSTSRICAWMVTSSAVVGSSAMIRLGSLAIAMAIITRWRMPPENSWGNEVSRRSGAGMPTTLISSAARTFAACSLSALSCSRRPSEIWWPTEYTGVSADSGSWKIIAISLPRRRESSRSSWLSNDCPRSRTSPVISALRGSSPITAIEETDLPDPDSPTIPRNSPSLTV